MRRTRATRARRGSALLLVLVAMVVLAVLSSAAMMSAFQEARSSRAAQFQQRAFAVAEYGLNLQLTEWGAQRANMALGTIDSLTVGVALGDSAVVRVQRLTAVDYQVVSVGRAGIGNGLMEAQRQVSLLVKMAAPAIRPGGIITSFGDVDVRGSPTVTGRNTTPPGWVGCPVGGADTVAISYRPGADIAVQKPGEQAIGGTRADPRAGDAASYDWAALAARANVRVTGNISPSPSGNSTTCNQFSSNWGEPWRGLGSVAGCQDYLPIVHAPGDLDLQNGRGQGILIVDGRLRVRGNFEFVGLILVRDDFEALGNVSIYGAVMSRNGDGSETRVSGNANLAYSRCAVERALAGLATPTRLRERAWANVY
jgi:hypothetical protein